MISESPANAGHAFVNDAEDYEERGDWVKAAQAHLHAAEQFQKAIEYAQDTVASKALSLLTNAHRQKAQDIQRRQLRVLQAKDKGPVIQSVTSTAGYTTMRDMNMNGLRNALPDTNRRFDPNQNNSVSTGAIGDSYALLSNDTDDEDDSDPFNKFWEVVETLVEKLSNPVAFASAPLSENDKPTPTRTEVELQQEENQQGKQEISAMLESYFVVPDHANMENTRIFFDKREREENQYRNRNRREQEEQEERNEQEEYYGDYDEYDSSNNKDSTGNKNEEDQEGGTKDGKGRGRRRGGTGSSLDRKSVMSKEKEENEQLKLKVEQLTRKIRTLEKTTEESNMLKSSILQFRNDVQKQAKRIMLNHDSTMRSSAAFGAGSGFASTYGSSYIRPSNNTVPFTATSTATATGTLAGSSSGSGVGGGTSSDTAMRLKELEEENRQLRLQNEKQQALVNKYRERWEKLKESAKKRRSQPSEEDTLSISTTRQPTLLQSLAQQSSSQSSYLAFASSRHK
ncbi:hypothetical protein F4703DRAFT_1833131 [Phycomyces blakesleeanus]